MPVVVNCPNCGKELSAPDELIGKLAACPECATRFPVGLPATPAPQTPPAAPGTPAPGQVPGQAPASPPSGTARFRVPPPSPPEAGTSTPPAPASSSVAPPAPPGTTPPQPASAGQSIPTPPGTPKTAAEAPVTTPGRVPTATPPGTPPSAPSQPATPPSSIPAAPSGAGPQPGTGSVSAPTGVGTDRALNTARFITSTPTETSIDLGEDGQLPELVLHEEEQEDVEENRSESTNPILLIVVLVVSFAASAGMLFIDTSPAKSESQSKAEAREKLRRYLRPAPLLKPYQEQLRSALQAHNQGDLRRERRYYRRVLNLLHAEYKNQNRGLTGQASRGVAGSVSDEELEELLSVLIGDD